MTEGITHKSCQTLKKMNQYLWPLIETLFLHLVEMYMQLGIDHMRYKYQKWN